MDSRHESLKEGVLNHIIIIINNYIQSNTETLISNESLRENIQEICHGVYQYLGVNVEIDEILSKQNLLSIDTVKFPIISDPEANKILNESDFSKLMNEIEKNVNKLEKTNSKNGSLREDLNKVLDEFKAEKNESRSFFPGFRR